MVEDSSAVDGVVDETGVEVVAGASGARLVEVIVEGIAVGVGARESK